MNTWCRLVRFLWYTFSFNLISVATVHAEIKNIIFDFGGVLIEIEHQWTAQAFSQLGAHDFTTFYSQNRQHEVFEQFEAGKLDPQHFRSFAKDKLGIPAVSDDKFDSAWNALIVGYRKDKIDFVKSLKQKFKVFLLSNTNGIHYDYFSALYEQQMKEPFSHFNAVFNKSYYAHFMQLKKPHPQIYQTVLLENNLDPKETLYVDDTPDYVKGAEAVGMHTLLITKERSIFSIPYYIESMSKDQLAKEGNSPAGSSI